MFSDYTEVIFWQKYHRNDGMFFLAAQGSICWYILFAGDIALDLLVKVVFPHKITTFSSIVKQTC